MERALCEVCHCRHPWEESEDELVPFVAGQRNAIKPRRVLERSEHAFLVYALSEDGAEVVTRFQGASNPRSIGLLQERRDCGQWHRLVMGLGQADYFVTLPKRQLSGAGLAQDIAIRKEPILEVRYPTYAPWKPLSTLERSQQAIEWRPVVKGAGAGPWRDL